MRGEEGPLPSRWPPLSLGGRCRAERRLNSRRRGVGYTAGGYCGRLLWAAIPRAAITAAFGCSLWQGAWEVPQGMLSG